MAVFKNSFITIQKVILNENDEKFKDVCLVFEDNGDYFIDLKKFIMNCKKNRIKLKSEDISIIFTNILKCIQNLSDLEISHRDIKPANILINMHFDIKLCDFGTAKIQNESVIPLNTKVTPRYYRSPEYCI